ncbi:hypothetical protein PHYC_02179 [Phycisphaerales bacterium]|nr:hypothetical protein PHYC_02179 [Phycisphaerales bacterium]
MASTLPTDPHRIVEFVSPRAGVWVENQAAIGSSPVQVQTVEELLAAAKHARDRALAARNAAAAATLRFYDAARRLRDAANVVIRNAKNTAVTSDDANVYALALLEPPKARAHAAPAPNQPQRLSATVGQDGAVTLRWRTRNPRGVSNVMYEVRRAIVANGGRGPFALLGIAGPSPGSDPHRAGGLFRGGVYRDQSIPVGTPGVEYLVTPVRGGRRGPTSAIYSLRFGSVRPAAPAPATTATTARADLRAAA